MFDQCLKILLIFGSFSAVARGEDEYTSTSTSTIAGNYNECYAGDPNCDWKNDPIPPGWDLSPYDGATKLFSYFNGSSPRGNISIRAVSPIFRRDENYGCVIIASIMYTESKSGLVGLRVYQKPVHIALRDLFAYSDEAKKDYILYEDWGDQDDWNNEEFPLKPFDSNFQIILEGICGEVPVHFGICPMKIKQTTECTVVYTPHTIPNRQTTSTLSTTTTMSTTTTERPMGENGDTITDKVTKSDTRVDSEPASPQSNLWWPTTKWPSTKQPTTSQSLPEGNGCDSRNPPIILYLTAPGNSLIDFRVRSPCSASAASGALTD